MLHNHPHALHIIFCITPVTQRVHVSKFQMILNTFCDSSGSQCDFTGNKVLAAALGLVVEQNAVDSKHTICFAILFYNPEAILLCNRIRAVWMERGCLALRNLFYFSIQFRSRCLVNFCLFGKAKNAACFQNTKNTKSIHIAGILRNIKRNLYMRLRSQIVNFIRLDNIDNTNQR